MQLRIRGSRAPLLRCLALLLMAFLASCGGGGGGSTAAANPGANPDVSIAAFSALKPIITAGTSTTLTAVFTGASSASVDQGVGPVAPGTGVTVSPLATTVYTLTASGLGGPVSRAVTVTVETGRTGSRLAVKTFGLCGEPGLHIFN